MTKIQSLLVTKASGESAPFSVEKLRASLERSGADSDSVNLVLEEIQGELYPGIPTDKLYNLAFSLLRKISRPVAARYKLKKAIMELGPSGFPFEIFIAGVLETMGYTVRTGIVLKGKCVKHEIDVLAEKDAVHCLVECKFHRQSGTATDVKVPLYIHSRFNDVVEGWRTQPGHTGKEHQAWLVTNTHFTQDAIDYARCSGMHLLGWDYPKHHSLKRMIDESGLHPVTCLTSLTPTEIRHILDNRVVFCRDIVRNPDILKLAGIRPKKINLVVEEATRLCRS